MIKRILSIISLILMLTMSLGMISCDDGYRSDHRYRRRHRRHRRRHIRREIRRRERREERRQREENID